MAPQTWFAGPGLVHYMPPDLQEPQMRVTTPTHGALPIDGGCHENKVGSEQALHQGEWDGGSFIYHNELSLTQFHSICRVYVLWERMFRL